MKVNTGAVSHVIGIILIFLGLLMWVCMAVGLYFGENDSALLWSGLISIGTGVLLMAFKRSRSRPNQIKKREGYLIVSIGWVSMCLFGALPYLFNAHINSPVNAVFESISGFTTTGATILEDIEIMPKSMLLWRSLTQWIGGMGIIVLTVALFPLLGIGGIELFVAEAPGPTSDKIHPRIRETAKRLWGIYFGLSVVLCLSLYAAGMGWFDSINHAMTTMATSGFSTKNASVAHWDSPAIQYIILLFMIIAGTNYTVTYFGLTGRFRKVWDSDEFRFYLMVLLVSILNRGFRHLRIW